MQREHPGVTPEAWLSEKHGEYEALAARGGFHANEENPVLLEQVQVVYPVKA